MVATIAASCSRGPEAPSPRITEKLRTSEESNMASGDFVAVKGPQFVVRHQPHAFSGVNFWAATNLAVAGPDGDRDRLLAELDHLVRLGVTHLRVMASSEGPDTEPFRLVPAMLVAPDRYNHAVLDGLDYLVSECGKRRIHLVMVLTNFWEWSGGMAQYVSWHESSEIPYPGTHDWKEFTRYASRFYGCAPCQDWYRQHIATLVSRVNPYTGLAYRDDPTVFAWELANEPRLYPESWIDDTAAFIKALDPNHLVTTGSEGEVGGAFVATHDGEHIDYATLHIWPQNWGWFDPQHPETFARTMDEALSYLEEHVAAARQLNKPLVLEEFGLAREWHPSHGGYDPNAATTLRDRFFRTLFDQVYASARQGGPLAGDSLWAWSGQGRPGDTWIGDPPHEEPGWYSVFDSDATTLEILEAHARRMAEVGR